MFSKEIAIDVKNVSKCFQMYSTPRDRLKQLVLPTLHSIFTRRAIGPHGKLNSHPPKFFREFWALHDISFQVLKGETVGILGLNGSGKSTLLQIICATLSPTSGKVEVNGKLAALLELGSGFNPEFTGRENVFLNGQILGLRREEIQERFAEIEKFADIGDFIDQPVKTYSSGMVVRLAFSVVVNVEPEILVIDEALAVGDMPFQIKCFSYLRKLRESGTSILFVSHSLSTIRSFCDKAVYLERGKCLAIGSANDVCKQYELDCISKKFVPAKFEENKVTTTEEVLQSTEELVPKNVYEYLHKVRPSFMQKERKGSGSLIIESFIIVDEDGIPVESIDPKQKVTAYALIRLNKSLSCDLHFGIQIHDRQGMPLMVVRDSEFEDVITGNQGDSFVLTMRFLLPLQPGLYYAQTTALLIPYGKKYEGGCFNFELAEITDVVELAQSFSMLPDKRHHIHLPVLNETKINILQTNLTTLND